MTGLGPVAVESKVAIAAIPWIVKNAEDSLIGE